MTENDFKTGDVVELKSGSMKMTIWFVNTDGIAFVYYYNPETKLIHSQIEIPKSVLKLVE
jgi:uncharacterized protein YodC (DUF2158 family)